MGGSSGLGVGFSLGGDVGLELGVGEVEGQGLGQDDHDLRCSLVLSHSSLGLDASDVSVLVVDEDSGQADSHGDTVFPRALDLDGGELVLEQLLGQEHVELELALGAQVDQVGARALLLLHLGSRLLIIVVADLFLLLSSSWSLSLLILAVRSSLSLLLLVSLVISISAA